MIDVEDLNNTEKGILECIHQGMEDERPVRQADIAKELELGASHISRTLDNLEEQGLVRRRKQGRCKKLYLTDYGAKIYLRIISGTPESDNNLLHLHKFLVKYPIKNLETVKDRRGEHWREKFLQDSEIETEYDEITDSYRFKDTFYQFRLTRKNVIIIVDDLVGNDPQRLKTRAMAKARKAAKWIQDFLSIQLEGGYTHITAEVSAQHIAIMNDPLSNLVNESEKVGAEVKVMDEDGNVRLWTDDSEGRKDLEAGTRGGGRGMAEDDLQEVLDWYSWLISNSETHKKFRRWMEEKFG